jgi:hypothetical protein
MKARGMILPRENGFATSALAAIDGSCLGSVGSLEAHRLAAQSSIWAVVIAGGQNSPTQCPLFDKVQVAARTGAGAVIVVNILDSQSLTMETSVDDELACAPATPAHAYHAYAWSSGSLCAQERSQAQSLTRHMHAGWRLRCRRPSRSMGSSFSPSSS